MRVLLIDPHTDLSPRLASLLGPHGLEVQSLATCEEADRFLLENEVGVVLLSSVLPDRSGVQYLKLLRSYPSTRDLPLIMLGSRATDIDVALSLDAGADDYVHKPASPHELQRRILAVIRRCLPPVPEAEAGTDSFVRHGRLALDTASRRAYCDGVQLPLRPSEVDLLDCLLGGPGRVFTRGQLVSRLCDSAEVCERVIDVHVRRLRVALAPHRADVMVDTVRGLGYRLIDAAGTPDREPAAAASDGPGGA
jgi:two-component system phosphate regulon response regulator PhoB